MSKEKKTKEKTASSRREEKPLTPKQRVFISSYTDIENKETFGNATKSAKKAYSIEKDNSAATKGSLTLRNEKVNKSITEILENIGMGSQVRMQVVKSVALGHTVAKSTTSGVTYDNDGQPHEYSTVTEHEPTARDRLAAVNLMEKVSGTYDKNRAKGEAMSAQLKGLINKHKSQYTRTVNEDGNDAG